MDICKVLRGCQWSPVRTSCTEVTRASGFPQFENVLNTLDFSTILQCRQVEAAGSELSQTRPHDFRFQILTQAFTHCLPVVAVYISRMTLVALDLWHSGWRDFLLSRRVTLVHCASRFTCSNGSPNSGTPAEATKFVARSCGRRPP